MTREIIYKITSEYAGQKVSEHLRAKGFSKQNLTDIKYNLPGSGIYVNNEMVLQNHLLSDGDELRVLIIEQNNSEKVPPVNIPIDIVYEDDDLIVVNKPSDMPIHPSLGNYENSLANALMYYYNAQEQDFVYRVINRLDRDTSGLTIVAKNIVSASILHNQQKGGQLLKEYYAVVEDWNSDLPLSGTIELPIGRKDGSTIERIIDFQNGENAITHFELISRSNGLSFIKLHLETGRTHQIRVHMKAIHHPLIGDFLYNPSSTFMNRQALHVGRIEFYQPITGERIILTADCPEDIKIMI